jgi:histidine triad (HIT) family protein
MPTLFTKIVRGEIPCHKIAEDDRHFAFLEIRPLAPGHTLVIPKEETDYLFDLEDERLGELMVFAKKVAAAVKQASPCEKVAVVVYGLLVRHAHVHLVPVNGTPGELDFRNQKDAKTEELAAMAGKIRAFFRPG